MSEQKAHLYNAFISYRHTEPDKAVAEKLHKLLETFRVPKSIVKATGRRKIHRVFRDRDELPTSSNLADNINTALENSEYLIVICSPRTPQSQWVLKEIETFSALHGHDRILALLIEGEPQESFPAELRFVKQKVTHPDGTITETLVETEPLAADIRASSTKEMIKNLKTELLRLLAPMLGCKYDDLKQRHKERLIKTILTVSLSLSAFFLAFGSFSTYQALLINQKSQEVIKHSEQTKMTQSLYLADISKRLLEEGDRYRATLVALEALPKNLEAPDRPYVYEAEYALSQALGVYDIDPYYDGDRVIDHDRPVNFFKVSPDKNTLLTSCRDGFLYMWNVADGSLIGKYDIGDFYANEEQTWFLDNSRILTLVDDRPTLIDLQGNTLWKSDLNVIKPALSPDGQWLACTYDDLSLVDTATGKIVSEINLKDLPELKALDHYITKLVFNQKGNKLGIGTNYGKLLILDLDADSSTIYETGFKYIQDIIFTPEEQIIVASNLFDLSKPMEKGQGLLQLFSTNEAMALKNWTFPYSSINKLSLNSSNPSQLLFLESEKLNVLDLNSGDLSYTFINGDKVSKYLVKQDLIVTASYDGTIRFFLMQGSGIEVESFRITRSSPIIQLESVNGVVFYSHHGQNKVYLAQPLVNKNTIKLEGHSDFITSGEFSPDGHLALTYSEEEVFLWSIPNKELLRSVSLNDRIEKALFTSDGEYIVVKFWAKKILLLKTSDLSTEKELDGSKDILSFYSDVSRVVLEYRENNQQKSSIYDLESLNKICTLDMELNDARFTPSDQVISYNKYKGHLSLYSIKDGKELAALEIKDVKEYTLSKDGTLLALAFKDKTVKLYSVNSGFSELFTLTDIKYPVTKLIISPDSKLLYIGLDDYSVTVYTTDSGELKGTIEDLGSNLEKVVYRADGQQVILVSTIKRAQLWNLPAFKQLASFNMMDIDKNFENLLANWNNSTIFMPLYNTQMLIDEAKKQLNGRILTEKERKTLFIQP